MHETSNPRLLYRYTTASEGTFSAGKRLLSSLEPALRSQVLAMVSANKSWLIRPELPYPSVAFYWTELGRQRYQETLLPLHEQYLGNISCESVLYDHVFPMIVYEDSYQVAITVSRNS